MEISGDIPLASKNDLSNLSLVKKVEELLTSYFFTHLLLQRLRSQEALSESPLEPGVSRQWWLHLFWGCQDAIYC